MAKGRGCTLRPRESVPGSASPGALHLEIDADSSHQLTWWDELVTRCAHTKHVVKAGIYAIFIRQVFAYQFDAPIGVAGGETQHKINRVLAIDFVSGGVVEDAMPKIPAVGIAQRAVKIAPAAHGSAIG